MDVAVNNIYLYFISSFYFCSLVKHPSYNLSGNILCIGQIKNALSVSCQSSSLLQDYIYKKPCLIYYLAFVM